MKAQFLGSSALVLVALNGAGAAELGDINGDGRVSYADAVWYTRWVAGDPVYQPATGSDAFDDAFPCTAGGTGEISRAKRLSDLIFLEGIRRASTSPLPHFVERWPLRAAPEAPLPAADPSLLVEVLPLVHAGGEAEIAIQVRVTSFVPLAGLELVFRAQGLALRTPLHYDDKAHFTSTSEACLVSGGELLVYRLMRYDSRLEIGEHELSLPALLVQGTPAGRYSLELVRGTEGVVEGTGEVIVPVSIAGEIELERAVEAGSTMPFPPFDFDDEGRRLLGATELRITEAEGFPGAEVTVRLQMRTERPVNKFAAVIRYDGWALECTSVSPVYVDPNAGVVLTDDFPDLYRIPPNPYGGEHHGHIGVAYNAIPQGYRLYETPWLHGSEPLGFEYISPLREWVDIAELRFVIREGASGKESTPIVLPRSTLPPYPPAPVFAPYTESHHSAAGLWGEGTADRHPCYSADESWWQVETTLSSGAVKVLGGGELREPGLPISIEEAGIRYTVGEAAGSPGDIVKLPLRVQAGVDFFYTWVVIGFDPARLDLVGYEVDHVDADGNPGVKLLTPDDFVQSAPVSCERDAGGNLINCRYGYPWWATLYGAWNGDLVPAGTLIASVYKAAGSTKEEFTDVFKFWAADQVHDAGRAVFRIREDATPGAVAVTGASVEWQPFTLAVPISLSSGAKPVLVVDPAVRDTVERYDVPALSVQAGSVRILGEVNFLRGDANQDGKLDVSDAVRTLGTLFLGAGVLLCPDAADANDDGLVNITDAVYSLDHLFRGGTAPPVPYPERGIDPTGDDLPCEE